MRSEKRVVAVCAAFMLSSRCCTVAIVASTLSRADSPAATFPPTRAALLDREVDLLHAAERQKDRDALQRHRPAHAPAGDRLDADRRLGVARVEPLGRDDRAVGAGRVGDRRGERFARIAFAQDADGDLREPDLRGRASNTRPANTKLLSDGSVSGLSSRSRGGQHGGLARS